MNHNPYTPPRAVVRDKAEPVRERPAAVVLAMRLIILSMALGLVNVAVDWRHQVGQLRISLGVLVAIQVVGFAIAIWFYSKIWAGRNWARILMLVFSLLSLPVVVPVLKVTFVRSELVGAMMVVGIILNAVVLYLLFGPGRSWFKRA